MITKQIVFTAPGVSELLEKEIPAPAAGEVQVEIAVSSISSGTERANLNGDVNVSVSKSYKEAIFPRTLGYSSAGTVIAVGEGVTRFKAGDRVALSWSKHQRCINMQQSKVFLLPDNVSFEAAALFHIAIFPLAAIRKCRLELGESAIVMGQGILGQIAVPLLRSAGAAPIIAVDPVPEKRARALELGADYALDPYAPDFAETAKALTNGGANVAIEVTGVGKALDGVLDCMKKMGRVALLGCTRHSDFTIDYYHKVHGPGISLIGAHTMARPDHDSSNGLWTQSDDMNALIKLTACGRLDLGGMVEETHSYTEAAEVYGRLSREPQFPIVQFDWRD
ncbi:MAG: zinc-binding dehydrogenase [Clostridia bacterium]|nr:zinc-binding dehydrogenase [Clostridia bacterium]